MNNIKVIEDHKFKDTLISLRFAAKKNSNVASRALLSIMLSDRSEKYNSKVLMNEKLDNMFGASLSSSVFNYGKAHIIELSLSALSERYVDEALLDAQVEMLSELVYYPLLNEHIFNEAKDLLIDMINREKESLGSYVVNESLRVAGKGFPLEKSRYGDLEGVKATTLDDVKAEYLSMVNNDSLNIIVVSDVSEPIIIEVFNKHFKEHNSDSFETSYLVDNNSEKIIVEEKSIPSPYYSIIYNTHTLNVDKDYWSLQLMCMVLGQMPSSFLFQEVREKRSLAYSVRSMVAAYDGVMVITGGVRAGHTDEAIEISLAQVKRVQDNEVSEDLFKSAQVMLKNSIRQTDDNSRRIIDSEYRKILLNETLNTNDLLNLVDEITLSDITDIANRLQLNVIYKLENV